MEVRLRSKETRAVLASLLLPVRLSAASPGLPTLSRQSLAERFWGDKADPRVHLRQALASLKTTFGDDCFLADQDTIRAAPGAFVTDIDRIRNAYQRALSATPEERLQWLIEAEGEIAGPFLEACIRPGNEGEAWLTGCRAELHGWLTCILLTLAEAFEEAGNLNGAMAAARRAVVFQPESAPVHALVWRLAELTGQEAALPTLDVSDPFEKVVMGITARGVSPHLTGEETRLFSALYKARLSELPAPAQKALPRLAVLPASFSPEIAREVARVPRRTLVALSQTSFLQRSGEEFFLPEVVRECAWRSVPSATKQQLGKRLAAFSHRWSKRLNEPADRHLAAASATVFPTEPYLRAAVQWYRKQPPTADGVDFLRRLPALGMASLACEAISYLDNIIAGDAYPMSFRYSAASTAGYILFSHNEFSEAIPRCEKALAFLPPHHDCVEQGCQSSQNCLDRIRDEGGLYFTLGNASHHAGDSRTALTYLSKAAVRLKQADETRGVTSCLRVRAEVLNHLEEYEEALQACEEALAIRRVLYPGTDIEADALFWKGSTLLRLGRDTEAAAYLEEALSIWQNTGDNTGVGFCLRLMGRLRADQGHFAEARAHIDHAILLHERANDLRSRLAAVEAKADVFLREKRLHEALPLFEECLVDYEAREHPKGIERLRSKIQNCGERISETPETEEIKKENIA